MTEDKDQKREKIIPINDKIIMKQYYGLINYLAKKKHESVKNIGKEKDIFE